ncbi:MAG: methyl-accepting chemotaxis protein [Oscillospiraceae bacterium]|nr:methyl-accepting chemotaxis protein [Oscillospiraceae bacterium]
MKNLKVTAKLLVSFAISIALMLTLGVLAIVNMQTMDRLSTEMYENQTVPLFDMSTIIELIQRTRVGLREYSLGAALEDQEMVEAAHNSILEYDAEVKKAFDTYRVTIDTSTSQGQEASRLFEDGVSLYTDRMGKITEDAYQMAKRGESCADIQAEIAKYTNDINVVVEDFDKCMNLKLESASAKSDSIGESASSSLLITIIILVAAVAVSVFLALYISGLISKPMSALAAFMQRAAATGDLHLDATDRETIANYSKIKDEVGQTILSAAGFVERITDISKALEVVASGDLTAEVETLSDADTMGRSLNHMVSNLNEMFGEINSSTAQVSTGSKQIADGAQSLAQGSTQQAAAVEELSSSISEIAEKTKTNAEMADKTAQMSDTIRQSAEKGSQQMDEMMSAVADITAASQSISKVIKTIDDIAFQTNILALNAAVEAARAGQHGKGFAVVAEEVRNLAAKSADAAKETGTMIQNSMEKAELGARIAGETAASLTDIVKGINESNQLIVDIAWSSKEQSSGIEQINTGIDQVAQVIQQNSATAEQSAASSEEMSGQANILEELISRFHLRDGGGMALHASPAGQKKQLAMPEKSSYSPDGSSADFGKY